MGRVADADPSPLDRIGAHGSGIEQSIDHIIIEEIDHTPTHHRRLLAPVSNREYRFKERLFLIQ